MPKVKPPKVEPTQPDNKCWALKAGDDTQFCKNRPAVNGRCAEHQIGKLTPCLCKDSRSTCTSQVCRNKQEKAFMTWTSTCPLCHKPHAIKGGCTCSTELVNAFFAGCIESRKDRRSRFNRVLVALGVVFGVGFIVGLLL